MNQKKRFGTLIRAAIGSLIWTLLTSFLGLTQLWLTLGVSYVLIDKYYSLSVAIQDGSLLFFIMAIVTAITIDHHFTEISSIPHWAKSIMFTLFPLIIGVLATNLYVILYIADENQVNEEFVANVQYTIIL